MKNINLALILLISSFLFVACIDVSDFVNFIPEEPPDPDKPLIPKDPDPQVDPNDPGGSTGVTDPVDPDKPVEEKPLRIERVFPAQGSVEGFYELRLRGQSFSEEMEIIFGSTKVLSQIFVSENTMRVVVAPGRTSCVDIIVNSKTQTSVLEDGFCYTEGIKLSSIEPARIVEGLDTSFELRGSGFQEPLSLVIGGVAAGELVVESDMLIRGIFPPLNPGKYSIRVVNAFGHDVLKDVVEVVGNLRVDEMEPRVFAANQGGTIVIKGESLANARAFIGGHEANRIQSSDSELHILSPALALGEYDIVIIGDGAQKRFPKEIIYRDFEALGAEIFSIYPKSAPITGGGKIHIEGKHFSLTDKLYLGEAEAKIEERSATQITAIIPKASSGATVDLRVGDTVLSKAFTYYHPLSVSSIAPLEGASGGGTRIKLEGEQFSEQMQVFLGTRLLNDLEIQDSQLASGISRAGTGSVPIVIERGEESLDTGLFFNFLTELKVFSAIPNQSPTTGGATIYITGSGFESDLSVYLGEQRIENFEVVDSNLLRFSSPPHSEGEVKLSLRRKDESVETPLQYFDPSGLLTSASGGILDGNLNVQVRTVDTGIPIPDALVQIGSNNETALKGKTNDQGLISFFDERLYGPQVVVACAQGYSCTSLQPIDARIITLYLEKHRVPSESEPPPPPPPPPDPNDINPIDITVPYTAKPSYIKGTVTGFDKVSLESDPNKVKAAVVLQSQLSAYVGQAQPGDVYVIFNDKGKYRIKARSGDVAVALLCGLYDKRDSSFDARFFGLKRGLFVTDGIEITADLACNLPLNDSLSVKLLDAPLKSGPNVVQASAFLFIGDEGYIGGFMKGSSQNNLVQITKMPPLRGDLEDAYFTVVTGAYTNYSSPSSVVYDYIVRPNGEILEQGPLTGIPIFDNNSTHSLLSTGSLSWTIENPQNVDFYSLSIRLLTNKTSNLIYQIYLPGSASSAEFPIQSIELGDDITNASLYVGLSAYKSAYKGYDFKLFSTMDLRYNNVLSSSFSYFYAQIK